MSPGPQQVAASAVDFAALFEGLPTAYLVMDPDLVIVAANQAYLQLLGRSADELVGRPVFEAFPPAPQMLDGRGANPLQASFERARDTGQPDTMPLYQYDVLDRDSGRMVPRFWSLISARITGPDGRARYVLQRVEDVTGYVTERAAAEREQGEVWQRRFDVVEADLFARAQELRAAVEAESVAVRRLGALADVALALGGADTIEDLTTTVITRCLSLLGADGGGVAVRDDENQLVRFVTAGSLRAGAQDRYGRMPLHAAVPVCHTARTGEAVLLSARADALAWSGEAAEFDDVTGLQAWAALPLRAGDALLGALTVGWARVHAFADGEVELLGAFAAQCAQALDRLLVRDAERHSAAQARQLSEALQRSLLTDPAQPEGVEIAVRYSPAAQEAQIGGDWYDAFRNGDGSTTLVIGDVAGHDRNAAALMGQVRGVLRGVAYSVGEPPAAVLSAFDRALLGLEIDTLASAVLVQLDAHPLPYRTDRHTVSWSNAGHPPPLLVQPDGRVELLAREPDLLLGLDPATARVDNRIEVEPGATLVLYTDGLVENRHQPLDVGLKRLADAAAALARLPLEDFCDALLASLLTERQDDVAILAVRPSSGPGPAGPRPPEHPRPVV